MAIDPATLMLGSAGIGGLSSLIGGAIGSNASQNALQTQREALKRQLGLAAPAMDIGFNANQDLATVYGLNQAQYRPNFYAQSLKPNALYPGGTGAGGQMGGPGMSGGDLQGRTDDFMERFMASPIYQTVYKNMLAEGTQAYERNATAAGRLNSGRTVLGIGDMAGRLVGSSLQDYIRGLTWLATGGAQAGGQAQNALQYGAQNIGNAQTGVGSAQAASVLGVGNAAGNFGNNLAFMQAMQQRQPGSTTSAYG